MTEEAEKLLLEKIKRLEDVIAQGTKEAKPMLLDVILSKLDEQGTQRGIIIILTAILTNLFDFDETMVSDLLTGAALIYGTHDIVTQG